MNAKGIAKQIRLLIGVIALATATASAQTDLSRAPPAGISADVGTGWNILSIPAAAFHGRDTTVQRAVFSYGYIYQTGGSESLWAPVYLPSGAGIGYLNVFGFDSNPTANLTIILVRYTGYGSLPCPVPPICPPSVPPFQSTVMSVATTGSGGYQYRSSPLLSPLHTVDNDVIGGGAQYVVEAFIGGPSDSSLAFKGVDIWWKRQISPAPGTASFTDVPLNAQFFAEIEALKASGITAGCTATEFCPDATLTRRQMAAFLARALGLYWQY